MFSFSEQVWALAVDSAPGGGLEVRDGFGALKFCRPGL
jgi:hypothetical protein